MATRICPYCNQPFNRALDRCPHCARPSHFPNVDDADDGTERERLAARYKQVCVDCEDQGTAAQRVQLEAAVSKSSAVRAMQTGELIRLANSDSQVANTYYEQINGRSRIPDNNEWDRLRRLADVVAFGSYYQSIQFAALTIDSRWAASYGPAALFFREEMIEHRATVFEDNLVLWRRSRQELVDIPPGYRAPWSHRHQLAVAKLGPSLVKGDLDLGELVLATAATTGDDSFIEAHIYGPYTIRSVSRALVKRGHLGELCLADLRDRANQYGFEFLEVT